MDNYKQARQIPISHWLPFNETIAVFDIEDDLKILTITNFGEEI